MNKMGIINVYKEKGYTSHDVVAIVRKTLKMKTGHTGTLDPQAEGVLPICVGRATKLASLITAGNKSYHAEVILGQTTDTGDHTGQRLTTASVDFDPAVIARVAATFMGEYLQTPPMYSALKVGGKKLYELAREGVTVERAPRLVKIEQLYITAFHPETNRFEMDVYCEKGTYIRSLCEDIGQKLGCGACMGDLQRTRSGPFMVSESVKLQDLKQAVADNRLADYIWSVEKALPLPAVTLKPESVKRALNGNPVPSDAVNSDCPPEDGSRMYVYDGEELIGIYEADYSNPRGGVLTPVIMLKEFTNDYNSR